MPKGTHREKREEKKTIKAIKAQLISTLRRSHKSGTNKGGNV